MPQSPRLIGIVVIGFLFAIFPGFKLVSSRAENQTHLASNRAVVSGNVPGKTGKNAIAHLKQEGSYDSLAAALSAARYGINWVEHPRLKRLNGAYEAENPAQGFTSYFTPEGVHLIDGKGTNPAWFLGLKLQGVGYGTHLGEISSGTPTATTNRVEMVRNSSFSILHSSFKEWFVNGPQGLEHGLIIGQRPDSGRGSGPVQVSFELESSLKAEAVENGQAVEFVNQDGDRVLRYDQLKVNDATGRALSARLTVEAGRLGWEIDDREAVYPITIDPTFSQQSKLTASDGAANDFFGESVAIDGETAVVGTRFGSGIVSADQGAAYVFVRTGMTWTQQRKLTAGDGQVSDRFGASVAIDGETVVVGATAGPGPTQNDSGAAYVFVRTGTTWNEQQKLTASDGVDLDRFGASVSIDGETILVGAPSGPGSASVDQGAAYVFVRSGTTWTQQTKLNASDGAANDNFGISVALDGETAVVGASLGNNISVTDAGLAYVFVRTGTTWTQQQRLVAVDGVSNDQFGSSVAIDGSTLVIGAIVAAGPNNGDQGAAYVYTRAGATWTQQQKLTASDGDLNDRFGFSVGIDGETVVVGATAGPGTASTNQGAAYVYVRAGTSWSQQQRLNASDGAATDNFGSSAAIDGSTILVGANSDDISANADQGSASVFTCTTLRTWVEQPQLGASDGVPFDQFGNAVAIDGETAVFGAFSDDLGGSDEGSAYVFVRTGTTWAQQQKLTAPDAANGAQFGTAVAIDQGTLVVSSRLNEQVYIYVRTGTTWNLQQTLTKPSGASEFGCSVAIDRETLVVGARETTVSGQTRQGSAYVYVRSGTTWSLQQTLIDPAGFTENHFGRAVAIDRETIVVGAPQVMTGFGEVGRACVFVRTGTTWSRQQQLDGNGTDGRFGFSVDIDGETIAAGAPDAFTNEGVNGIKDGAAYVYVRTGGTWGIQARLVSFDAGDSEFGSSVTIDGERLVSGAHLATVPSIGGVPGAAYTFTRTGTSWSGHQRLTASNPFSGDRFGAAVAMDGDTLAVGTPFKTGSGALQGAVYMYALDCPTCSTVTTALTGATTICQGDSTTLSVMVTGGTPPYTVTLTNGGGTQTGNSPLNFTVSPGSSTTYSVQSGTDALLCPTTTGGSAAVTVTPAPTPSDSGPDQTLCTGAPATMAANSPGSGTGVWSVQSAPAGGSTSSAQFSNPASPTATFTPNPVVTGNYALRWTISTSSPCNASVDALTISYQPAPTTANAGPDQTVCSGSPATLAANAPTIGNGSWSVVTAPGGGSTASGQFNNPASPTAVFTPSPAVLGNYTLRWTISNSVCTPSTDDVVLTYSTVAPASNAGPDQTVCTGSPATLAGNSPANGSGTWSVVTAPAGGSTTSTQFNNAGSGTAIFTPNPAVVGSYTLRWTISSNSGLCTPTTDDVVVTFVVAPTASNSGPDQVLCPGSPATLAANSPTNGTGIWSVQSAPAGGSTSAAQFSNPASPTATFTPNPAVTGNYALRWTISNPPCIASSDALTIAYDTTPPTTADAGPDQTICNSSVVFLAANFPTSGNGTWSVVTAPAGGSTSSTQFDDPTSPSSFFIADPFVLGSYTLRWTISGPCASSTDDVVFTFVGPPTGADAGPDQTLCVGSPATLAGNTPTSGIGTWTVVTAPAGGSTSPAQFSDRNLPNAIFTPNPAVTGGYVLAWTIGTVCVSGSDLLTITYQTAPTTANAGPDQMLCVTSPGTMLAANTPTNGSGTWSVVTAPAGGSTASTQFSNPGTATAIFTPNPAVAGNYTLRWSISNSLCPASTDDVVVTYLAPPTTATVGGAQTICINGTTVGLGGNIPTNGTGIWSVVNGGTGTFSPNATTSNATFTHTGGAGPVMVQWTISNSPCTASSATVTITISQPPTTATVGSSQTICVNGTTASLGGNTPSNGTGQWSVVSGGTGTFSSATNPNATFTHTGGTGPITVQWTISNGICADSSATTTITITPPPTTATVGGPQTICGNGTTTGLGGNIPVNGTGNWSVVSGGTGTFSPNSATPNATFMHTGGTGPIIVRWTISNSPCTPDSTADVTITISPASTTATVGGPQIICTGGITSGLGGNTPITGTGGWSVVGGGTGNFLPNATTPNAMFQHTGGAGPVMVRWTISNGFCPDSSATVAISITQSPSIATVGGPQTICARTTTGGLGGNTPVIGSGQWSVVSGGTGTFSPNATTPNATFTHTGGAGPMTLRWTISNPPCAGTTADVVITVNPAATVNAGPDQGICRENPVATLAASLGGGASSGTWTGGAGSFAPNNTAPNATYTPTAGEIAAGTVTLTYTTNDPVGPCLAVSDEVTITITSCLGLMVADTTNNRIQAFDGANWAVIGVGTVGSGDGQFRLPEAVTFDGDGRIYVADTGNNRIQWSTDSGVSWTNFAVIGSALNQVRAPQGLALDSAGNLYVSDTGNGRVMRFNGGVPGTGVVIASNGSASGQVGSPRGLAIDDTFRLFVTDESNSRILRISNASTTVSATSGAMIATLGTALNKVKNPQGIAIDGNGTLFVADTGNSRVLRWINANPNNATTLALTGSALGQVNQPEGVTITQFITGPLAGSPLLVVGDTSNNRIQGRPLPTGGWTLVGTPNGIGSGVGQFRSPSKIQ